MASSGASALFGRLYPNLTDTCSRALTSAAAPDLRSVPPCAAVSKAGAPCLPIIGIILRRGVARDRIPGITGSRGRPNGRSVHVCNAS